MQKLAPRNDNALIYMAKFNVGTNIMQYKYFLKFFKLFSHPPGSYFPDTLRIKITEKGINSWTGCIGIRVQTSFEHMLRNLGHRSVMPCYYYYYYYYYY